MSDTNAEPDTFLATRRSRRSTAGNRMEAALAEMALETTMEAAEDDVDFVNDKDEEDVFGSDFESTDEEAAQGDPEAGEIAIQEEERRARKDIRSKIEKATAAAHAKHKVTFNPQAQATITTPKSKESKRRVSLGAIVNAETGEVLAAETVVGSDKKRHSQRKHTILNTSATVKRMKRSQEKKASTPKKVKTKSRVLTQAELIALALDNEEGNIVEHRDYLKTEEEKRRRARVIRTAVEGPLIKWISKGEDTKVSIQPPPVPSFTSTINPYNTMGTTLHGQNSQQTFSTSTLSSGAYFNYTSTAPSVTTSTPTPMTSSQVISAQQLQYQLAGYNPYFTHLQSTATATQSTPLQPIERTERVTKNYVVHELSQYEGVPKPQWHDTMSAMFGEHVKWDEVKVYVGKGRPLSRPKQMCPITGKLAKYLDPRTGVPYADLRAYKVLTSILKHEFVWSPALKCYVGREPIESAPEGKDGEDIMTL